MRTFIVAVATALLLWACIILNAQSPKLLSPTDSSKAITATTDSLHTNKILFEKASFRNISTSLGSPAGKKIAGNSKREADSLQQIILLRKKF